MKKTIGGSNVSFSILILKGGGGVGGINIECLNVDSLYQPHTVIGAIIGNSVHIVVTVVVVVGIGVIGGVGTVVDVGAGVVVQPDSIKANNMRNKKTGKSPLISMPLKP